MNTSPSTTSQHSRFCSKIPSLAQWSFLSSYAGTLQPKPCVFIIILIISVLVCVVSDFLSPALTPSIKHTTDTSCRLVTWQQWFTSTLKGNDLCQSVCRSSSPPPPFSLWGASDYVFCQCVCGNLLICTNTDSNAPATAAFLADGWLGCRLMAESARPQLGAGNIAHYTSSREGGGLIHTAAQHAGVGVIISF